MCRLAYLYPLVAENPGLSVWELSELAQMDYQDASHAMAKGRRLDLFKWDSEEREQGGVRYRYFVLDDGEERLKHGIEEIEERLGQGLRWDRPGEATDAVPSA